MIKIRLGHKEDPNRHMALLGLTTENMVRILDGQPIKLNLSDIGLPDQEIIIIGGLSNNAIMETLKKEFDFR